MRVWIADMDDLPALAETRIRRFDYVLMDDELFNLGLTR